MLHYGNIEVVSIGDIMASEKPMMILKSKSDLSEDDIVAMSDAEAWELIYSIRATKEKDNRLQVCFTGFGASKKAELVSMAEDNHLKVVSSVTQHCDSLVGGENAGPKKVDKAKSQGVQLLNEDEFICLLDTGELPRAT